MEFFYNELNKWMHVDANSSNGEVELLPTLELVQAPGVNAGAQSAQRMHTPIICTSTLKYLASAHGRLTFRPLFPGSGHLQG